MAKVAHPITGERLNTKNTGALKPKGEVTDDAEKAVANDKILLGRLQRARLPLQFSELEILRTDR